MIVSVPPDSKLIKEFTHFEGAGLEMLGEAYETWISNHPSALCMFEQMMNAAKGKQIVIFLDYDGTLSPIVDDPERAYMSDAMRSTVREVAYNFPTAIISGRCIDKNWNALVEQVRSVLKDYPQLCLTQGRKVLEVRPSIKWDKGNALEFILESLGLASCSDVIPLYIGDDKTDEDAFKVLRAKGQGYPIIVSSIPKETNAAYSLHDPSEVMEFLHHLVKWKKSSSRSRSKV